MFQKKFLQSCLDVLQLNFYGNNAKFILVLNDEIPVTSENITNFFLAFKHLRIMKSIIISQRRIFAFGFLSQFHEIEKSDDPFHDGIVQGYEYRVLAGNMRKQGSKLIGVDLLVMDLIAQRDRSSVNFIEVPGDTRFGDVLDQLENGSVDLFMHSGIPIHLHHFMKLIITYEEGAYCALVPLPPRLTFLHFLLKPLDPLTCIVLLASLAISAFIFQRLSRSFKLAIDFVYFVIGQFVEVKVKRQVLVLLLQLFGLMTFILGNGYESLIISSMTASREGTLLETFDQLFSSDMTFLTDTAFRFRFSGDNLEQRMIELPPGVLLKDLIGSKFALISSCKQVLPLFSYLKFDFDISTHFYILPEQTMKFYEKLHLAWRSPFYDHLQLQHDRIFEAGLRQYFTRMLELPKLVQRNREIAFIENEKYLLFFDDVKAIFILVLYCHGIGLIVFAFEMILKNYFIVSIFIRRLVREIRQSF